MDYFKVADHSLRISGRATLQLVAADMIIKILLEVAALLVVIRGRLFLPKRSPCISMTQMEPPSDSKLLAVPQELQKPSARARLQRLREEQWNTGLSLML